MNIDGAEYAKLLHLRIKADQAEQTLLIAVAAVCPGPHKPTQHRDMRPRWCKVCGLTTRGVLATKT